MNALQLSQLDQAAFVHALGAVFEHSPWVAERAWSARPFADVAALHHAMVAAMHAADTEQKLALIRAHPELAGKEAQAGTLTADSRGEQASAGLNHCSPDELARLRRLNAAYRDRFGFPFVMAVKHRSRAEILSAMENRLGNSPEVEFATCITEIGKIARFRLDALLTE